MQGMISLSQEAADGIEAATGCPTYREMDPEKVAWIWFLLRPVEDTERYFPRGKWATLQEIECQLSAEARAVIVAKLLEERP